MFTSQLLESAKDELSFRSIVRNLQFKSAVLQIVLLNPNSWCCTGYCLLPLESASKIVLHPTVKVLFTASSHGDEFDTGLVQLQHTLYLRSLSLCFFLNFSFFGCVERLNLGMNSANYFYVEN